MRLSLFNLVQTIVIGFLLLLMTPMALAETGTSNATMTLNVPVVTAVTCVSTPVTAPSGTQTNTLAVVCTITGNPNNLATGTANAFSPSSVTLNSGGNSLTASLQSSITSPDSSVTSIVGNSGGFTGSLVSGSGNTWKVQAHYTVPTTSTTPAGSYTGTATYTWSTI